MIRPLLIAVFLLVCSFSIAQTFLQIEKKGSFKTERYYVGDLIHFQLEGEDYWYEESIEEIFLAEGVIHFTNRVIPINKISAIRDYDYYYGMKSLGNKLVIFAGSFTALSLLATLADWELSIDTAIIGGSAVVLGLLFKWIFKHKTWKVKGKTRLRLLSLDMA